MLQQRPASSRTFVKLWVFVSAKTYLGKFSVSKEYGCWGNSLLWVQKSLPETELLRLAHMRIKLNKWVWILLTKFPKKTCSTTAKTTVYLCRLWVKNACVYTCLEYWYKDSNDKWFPANFFCRLAPCPRIKINPGKPKVNGLIDLMFRKKR